MCFLSNMVDHFGTKSGFLNAVSCDMSFSSMSQTLNKIQNVEFKDQILESQGLSNAKTFQRDLHDPKPPFKNISFSTYFLKISSVIL